MGVERRRCRPKLDWFRLGGEVSERQWRDILGVLKTQQSALDIDYLRQWAQTLDVADLMEYALEELTYIGEKTI